MQQRFWIIEDSRIKRDRYGKKYRPHARCCQRGELCLVGRDLSLGVAAARLEPMAAELLLALMLRRPGVPVTEAELLGALYDRPDFESEGNPVGVLLTKVRRALRAVGGPEIENRWGYGWLLS